MGVLNSVKALYGITLGASAAKKALITDQNSRVDGALIGDSIQSEEITIAEEGAAGTYTGNVTVPKGATILDVVVHAVALWGAGTSATLIVGDVTDPDGFLTAVDLKATDLLADESISQGLTGGKEGADWDGGDAAGDASRRRYSATARVVTAEVITVGTTSSIGRTRVTVVWSLPSSPVAATYVAT